TVRIDLAERRRVVVARVRITGRYRVVADALDAARLRGAPRVDAQDRRDDGIEPLRRRRVVRVRPAAVAEAEVAAARVQEAVVVIARRGRRIEADEAERMRRVRHDVRDTQQLPMAPFERARARVVRADRKSTRLNSSHVKISYAVFC